MSARFHLYLSATFARSRSTCCCPATSTDIAITAATASTGRNLSRGMGASFKTFTKKDDTIIAVPRRPLSDQWLDFSDEQLLDVRMADLPLAIEGPLADRIAQLRSEL